MMEKVVEFGKRYSVWIAGTIVLGTAALFASKILPVEGIDSYTQAKLDDFDEVEVLEK